MTDNTNKQMNDGIVLSELLDRRTRLHAAALA
jgi:hypothetical protein